MSSLSYTDNLSIIHASRWDLTSSEIRLVSPGRRGRTLLFQAAGGTVLLGGPDIATSGIGMQITGYQILNDCGSASWYAVGVGGVATLNVLEIY